MGDYENVQRGPLKLKKGISKTKRKKNEVYEPIRTSAKTSEGRTEAEKRFEEKRKQRTEDKLRKEAQISYRSKVEKFNEQLSKEPEHFDVPKVCPTK
ncbi:hypothetical protein Gasu2_40490 [Galdieria sulphuraria]|uniref:Uncharacterized protein n=1 Tax=Galdieria sulphuraria TaxID=130081 RepID=M2W7Z3_GALSU|nr:uncharacterized protein Gasu_07110 [Galdieria sulphuraria]EME31961.1 hypothetical protein Gasu_07110 [Galdieria sulphuraria]GJD09820.1 hypothetical protein Gasu2_40490 [Galdieria sulphuraria]|eukprot:XP_005708481.1 hypothetical protein Gasu_07110 [Galdieria sulphuraria]